MTNADNLRSMDDDVLAWWMNLNMSECHCCIYDGYDNCNEMGDKMTCIKAITEWLKREPNERDMMRFQAALHNAMVSDRNKQIEAHNAEVF